MLGRGLRDEPEGDFFTRRVDKYSFDAALNLLDAGTFYSMGFIRGVKRCSTHLDGDEIDAHRRHGTRSPSYLVHGARC